MQRGFNDRGAEKLPKGVNYDLNTFVDVSCYPRAPPVKDALAPHSNSTQLTWVTQLSIEFSKT